MMCHHRLLRAGVGGLSGSPAGIVIPEGKLFRVSDHLNRRPHFHLPTPSTTFVVVVDPVPDPLLVPLLDAIVVHVVCDIACDDYTR